MEKTKEQFRDSEASSETVLELKKLEKTGYSCISTLIEERRYNEAEQVLDMLRRVGVV